MAKKPSKSSRHARATNKKQAATKHKSTVKLSKKPAIIAKELDEPVMKTERPTPHEQTPDVPQIATPKELTAKPSGTAVEAKVDHESIEDMMQPARTHMLVSAFALAVIVIALIFSASIIHQNTTKQAEMVKPGQDSSRADQILQSGGAVCTNGSLQTDTTGSANPSSVGMILQSNPTNTIQTPQTLSNGTDVTTLQGATCF